MLDPYEVRKDFPILNRRINDKKLIYFDNAATSQRPIQVIRAITEFYEKHNANIHRGFHTLSQEASDLYEEAHEVVAKFIGAKSGSEIVFVRNTTEALNAVAMSWGLKNLCKGDEIVISIMEHHSNMLPWFKVAEAKEAKVKVIYTDEHGRLIYNQLEEAITENTRIVAITHMSNVLGTINDVKKIAKLAHSIDAIVVVDGAQSVPHMPVNVRELNIDFLAFSGHKMLGPTGIGVLYVKEDLMKSMGTFMVGGGTIKEVHYRGELKVVWDDFPWKFEAGTPNIAGAVGLMEAVKYLNKIGMENIFKHEIELVNRLLKGLSELEGVKICGPLDLESRGGIVSFTIKSLDPHSLALLLDEEGIAVRSGFHCAQPLHEYLGFKSGTVRVSFYLYNTKEEVDRLIEVLRSIVESLKK